MDRITINAVVFRQDGLWVAQCLEYNLVSCAEDLEELPSELMWQIQALVSHGRKVGREPFADFGRAPAKYWEMFEQARKNPRPLKPFDSAVPQIDAHLHLAA